MMLIQVIFLEPCWNPEASVLTLEHGRVQRINKRGGVTGSGLAQEGGIILHFGVELFLQTSGKAYKQCHHPPTHPPRCTPSCISWREASEASAA